jgi:hypothetical protein
MLFSSSPSARFSLSHFEHLPGGHVYQQRLWVPRGEARYGSGCPRGKASGGSPDQRSQSSGSLLGPGRVGAVAWPPAGPCVAWTPAWGRRLAAREAAAPRRPRGRALPGRPRGGAAWPPARPPRLDARGAVAPGRPRPPCVACEGPTEGSSTRRGLGADGEVDGRDPEMGEKRTGWMEGIRFCKWTLTLSPTVPSKPFSTLYIEKIPFSIAPAAFSK